MNRKEISKILCIILAAIVAFILKIAFLCASLMLILYSFGYIKTKTPPKDISNKTTYIGDYFLSKECYLVEEVSCEPELKTIRLRLYDGNYALALDADYIIPCSIEPENVLDSIKYLEIYDNSLFINKNTSLHVSHVYGGYQGPYCRSQIPPLRNDSDSNNLK